MFLIFLLGAKMCKFLAELTQSQHNLGPEVVRYGAMLIGLFLTAEEIDLEKLCIVTGRREQGANLMIDLSLYPECRHPPS